MLAAILTKWRPKIMVYILFLTSQENDKGNWWEINISVFKFSIDSKFYKLMTMRKKWICRVQAVIEWKSDEDG